MPSEGLIRILFTIQMVSALVTAVAAVFLVMYVIKTWEQTEALRRMAGGLERTVEELAASRHAPTLPEGDTAATPTLEQLVADLASVRTSLEQIPAALTALRGDPNSPPALVGSTSPYRTAEAWRADVNGSLKEFRVLWTAFYGGKRERLNPQFITDLQVTTNNIADALLSLIGNRPESVTTPSATAVLGIVVALQELGQTEVDPEGGPSLDEFDAIGEKLIAQIDGIQ